MIWRFRNLRNCTCAKTDIHAWFNNHLKHYEKFASAPPLNFRHIHQYLSLPLFGYTSIFLLWSVFDERMLILPSNLEIDEPLPLLETAHRLTNAYWQIIPLTILKGSHWIYMRSSCHIFKLMMILHNFPIAALQSNWTGNQVTRKFNPSSIV